MARRLSAATHDAAPETLLRIAVLLQAGVSPVRAWAHLAESGDEIAAGVRSRVDRGMPLAAAIAGAGGAWTLVASAWSVASTVGAPLAETLRGLAAVLRDESETADQVRIALAEPAGTARLMGWLPLVAIGLGGALGFDTLVVLLTNPIGLLCLAVGAALLIAARRWTTVLVRRARTDDAAAGLGAELLAIALSGGVSLDRARAIVADAGFATTDAETASILALSRSAGVPAVELLRAAASLARHRARVAGRLRAAALSSKLLLPLGVCTLPAFLLLGVAPMILSVLSTMSLTL